MCEGIIFLHAISGSFCVVSVMESNVVHVYICSIGIACILYIELM